jgi:hypothetical protein
MFLKVLCLGNHKATFKDPLWLRFSFNCIRSYAINEEGKLKMLIWYGGEDLKAYDLCQKTHSIEELDAKLLHYNPVADLLYNKIKE